MNNYQIKFILTLILAVLFSPAYAGYYNKMIDVSVVSDHDGKLNKYPVSSGYNKEKAYVMAKKGHSYGIKIRNKTTNRIGVVVAVDGRNIISGKKSHLNKNERMYILDPFESATYTGWRTGSNQVNRFYFTKAKHSYAAAFGDHSAMGVIAVAAFEEKHRHYKKHKKQSANKPRNRRHSKQPGTGFGEEEYSPVVKVHFKPKHQAGFTSFLKYEWKQVLCKKGIISCHKHHYSKKPHNRFWEDDSDDYAPYPSQILNWKKGPFFSHRKHQ